MLIEAPDAKYAKEFLEEGDWIANRDGFERNGKIVPLFSYLRWPVVTGYEVVGVLPLTSFLASRHSLSANTTFVGAVVVRMRNADIDETIEFIEGGNLIVSQFAVKVYGSPVVLKHDGHYGVTEMVNQYLMP